METIAQLNEWLDHPVYETGVVLYERLIGAGFVLTNAQMGSR